MNTNTMTFLNLTGIGYPAANVRRAMHKLTGISTREMARRLGCTHSAIVHTERGIRVNIRTQTRLAAEYGIPVEIFFADVLERDA